MRKIIFIGRSECGKTSLTQALRGEKITYREYEGMNHWTWDRAYAEYDDINALFNA